MLISVVPIGNSKGIRIPKSILQQLNIEDKVELEVHNREILIRPVTKNRGKAGMKSLPECIKMEMTD